MAAGSTSMTLEQIMAGLSSPNPIPTFSAIQDLDLRTFPALSVWETQQHIVAILDQKLREWALPTDTVLVQYGLRFVVRLCEFTNAVAYSDILVRCNQFLHDFPDDDTIVSLILQIVHLCVLSDAIGAVGSKFGLEVLLTHFDRFQLGDQRICVEIMHLVTNTFKNIPGFLNLLVPLGAYFTHYDPVIFTHVIHTFTNIATSTEISASAIPPEVMSLLAVGLQVLTEPTSVHRLLSCVAELLKNNNLAAHFLQSPFDLALIRYQVKTDELGQQILEDIVTIVGRLLPPADGFQPPFIPRLLDGGELFATRIEPWIEDLLSEKVGCGSQLLRILAACLRLSSPRDAKQLFDVLCDYALNREYIPDIFHILQNMRDRPSIKKDGIQLLTILNLSDPSRVRRLQRFVELECSFPRIPLVTDFHDAVQLPLPLFFLGEGVSFCTIWLQREYNRSILSIRGDLAKLVRKLDTLLELFPFRQESDCLISDNVDEFFRRGIRVLCRYRSGDEVIADDAPKSIRR
jgi:hypothetical protein